MRPRKVILCVDSNEHAGSVRGFMLETRGYRVKCALDESAALQRLGAGGIDLAIWSEDETGAGSTIRMKNRAPDVPILLLAWSPISQRECLADAVLPKDASAIDLLERIRILLVRKRGPKPLRPNRVAQKETATAGMVAA